MTLGWPAALALALFATPWLEAGDFRVDSTASTEVAAPSIAKGPAGDYFVAWQNADGIRGRRFGTDGLPLAADFLVNDPLVGPLYRDTSVARFLDGSHVVAWSTVENSMPFGEVPLSSLYVCHVYYRTFHSDGSPNGPPVDVGSDTSPLFGCSTSSPSAATQPDGSGIVVYQQGSSPGPSAAFINGVRFPASGNLPNVISSTIGATPSIAVGPGGEFAVAWWGPSQPGGGYDTIFVRLFASDGTPQGLEFPVNELPIFTGFAHPPPHPTVAFCSQGSLLVVWSSLYSAGSDASLNSVQGRLIAEDGTMPGAQFQLNTLTADEQSDPVVSALPDGSFLVAWQSQVSSQGDTRGFSIQARHFLADGSPDGPEHQVNATEPGDQIQPALGVDASGTPTFVWATDLTEVRASDDRTDLGITVTDGATTTQPGATLQYVVTVTDAGPADAPGTSVSTPFPSSLSCTWTCTGTGGASCGAGVHPGGINDVADVPVGGMATYAATCLVEPDASGTLLVTANVSAPVDLVDTNPVNDTATDTTQVVGLVIDDLKVDEGNAGTSVASFAVRLLSPVATPVTVDFGTGDGTATSGSDYLAASGTLTFAPGETLHSMDVVVLGDTTFEVDETFFVTLSNASGETIVDGLAVGTILNDDSALPSGSLDELVHGSSEVKSLESAPGPSATAQYWRVQQQPLSSYEVVVDATSGDLGPQGPALERVASDGSIVQAAGGAGAARSLRWESSGSVSDESIRVQSRGCIDDCDAADVFRVRMWETTAFTARFNNSASQVTVQVLENLGADPVTGNVHFTDPFGALLLSQPFTLPVHGTLAMNTPALVPGASGSIRVTSDAGYGMLQGKAVAVEPATGFTFDTPLVPRPR
jgi:hypothetical protein